MTRDTKKENHRSWLSSCSPLFHRFFSVPVPQLHCYPARPHDIIYYSPEFLVQWRTFPVCYPPEPSSLFLPDICPDEHNSILLDWPYPHKLITSSTPHSFHLLPYSFHMSYRFFGQMKQNPDSCIPDQYLFFVTSRTAYNWNGLCQDFSPF